MTLGKLLKKLPQKYGKFYGRLYIYDSELPLIEDNMTNMLVYHKIFAHFLILILAMYKIL